MSTQRFYSHGKLLLSGEYLVLDGISALGVPCKFGQDLQIKQTEDGQLIWKAYNSKGALWAQFAFDLDSLRTPFEGKPKNPEEQLRQFISKAISLRADFLKSSAGVLVETHLEFPQDWGLGSSSTLVHNIASWAAVNPYELLEITMGGSGYDLSCASATTPILYNRDLNGYKPNIKAVTLSSDITDHLLFVHLNQKQNSRSGIDHYLAQKNKRPQELAVLKENIEKLSIDMAQGQDLDLFLKAMETHEHLLSNFLELRCVQSQYFSDFKGQIKSLGAWGGDFVMAASPFLSLTETKAYFKDKGYPTILTYKEMVW